MEVRVLGAHNLETSHTHHTCFLIDGTMAIDAGSIVSTLGEDEQWALTTVILTHLHFDHTRDIPTLGLATLDAPTSIDVYSLGVTLDSVRTHLMGDEIYPDLTKPLNDEPPSYKFHPIDGMDILSLNGYTIKPVPVEHPVPTVGYIVQANSGECVAYTGDTGGSLLPFMRDSMQPKTLFVDVTFPNRLAWRAQVSGHLTPNMLQDRLQEAIELGIELPKIVPVHMSLEHEDELLHELSSVESHLSVDLAPGQEGMVVGAS